VVTLDTIRKLHEHEPQAPRLLPNVRALGRARPSSADRWGSRRLLLRRQETAL